MIRSSTLGGLIVVIIAVSAASAQPANDTCANAEPVAVPSLTAGSLVSATAEVGPPPACMTTYANTPGVWYRLVGNGNTLQVDLCSTASSFDSKLHIYCSDAANPCGSPISLTCVAGNDDGTSPCGMVTPIRLSKATFCSAPLQTYYILVSTFSPATPLGDFTLAVTDSGTGCTPTVTCTTTAAGACCTAANVCSITLPEGCTGASVFQGSGVACTPNLPCALGACCAGDGTCTVTRSSQCAGSWQGPFTACTTYDLMPGSGVFEDISTTGTLLSAVSNCDDCGEVVPLPFVFSFFGTPYSSVWVCSNGFIQFGGANNISLSNAPIPSAAVPNNFIAPMWDDLTTVDATGSGAVYIRIDGPSGSQRAIISWQNVRQFNMVDDNSFQVVLHQGSDEFELRYGLITPEAAPGDYTVGYENATGTAGGSVPGSALGAGNVAYRSSPPMPTCAPALLRACCIGSSCFLLNEIACTLMSGTWLGQIETCTPANPCVGVVNDTCAGAAVLALGVPGTADTTLATDELSADDAPTACAAHRTAWWTYTPATSGFYRVSTCASAFNTVVSVFRGPCTDLTDLACRDDSPFCTPGHPADRAAIEVIYMHAGVTHSIRVGGAAPGDAGLAAVLVEQDPHVALPNEPPGPDDPAIGPNEYAQGELLWTFESLDAPAIRTYLESSSIGAGVQVFGLFDFPDASRSIAFTSTPPCREVFQCLGFNPVSGLPPTFNVVTGAPCPSIPPPPGQLGLVAVEPNLLVEQLDRARIPNDPLFGAQWNLNNRGQVVGYVFRDTNTNGQVDPPEPIYLDNGNMIVDGGDQLEAGIGVANGATLRLLPANVRYRDVPDPSGGTKLVFYDDANSNGFVSNGETRIYANGLKFTKADGTFGTFADGSAVAVGDHDNRFFIHQSLRGTIDADVDAPQAWVHGTDCDGFITAVIDSGSDLNNADLTANLWQAGGVRGVSYVLFEGFGDANASRSYDAGELVYIDNDGTHTVSIGDTRLTDGGAAGLGIGAVAAGNPDLTNPPRNILPFQRSAFTERFVDLDIDGVCDQNEPVYRDFNLNSIGDGGDAVLRGSVALNLPLLANFPANHAHTGGTFFVGTDRVYIDVAPLGRVSAGDTRLTPSGALAAGVAVAAGDADEVAKLALNPFVTDTRGIYIRHIDNAGGNAGAYDAGEAIYDDRDNSRSVTAGDRRLSTVKIGGATYAANTAVAAADNDATAANKALVDFRDAIEGNDLQDTNGHGTAVASVTAAAGNNGQGLTGVCWRAKIMTLRVTGSGKNHTAARLVAAANWMLRRVINNGDAVRLVNYSHGRESKDGVQPLPLETDRTILTAMDARKILFVAAAGNAGNNNDLLRAYPAKYTTTPAIPNVLAIGGTDSSDRRVLSFGPASVNFGAPAQRVPVLRLGGNGRIMFIDGTSFAAPAVTGILAQAITLFPNTYNANNGHHAIRDLVADPRYLDDRRGCQGAFRFGKSNAGRARLVQGADFGDAPDPLAAAAGKYPTRRASMGALHEDLNEEWLGKAANLPLLWFDPPVPMAPMLMSNASPEFDAVNAAGQPNDPDGAANIPNMDAHDDGVEILDPLRFTLGANGRFFNVRLYIDTANNGRTDSDADNGRYAAGHNINGVHATTDSKFIFVNMWIDWNRDGDWADANEHVLLLRVDPSQWMPAMGPPVSTGAVYTIRVLAPTPPAGATSGEAYARVRLEYGENAGQRFPENNEMFFTNFANPFTAPGAMFRTWAFPGGLPLMLGAGTRGRLWETPDPAAPGSNLPATDLALGISQFGEVEDYLVNILCPSDVNNSGTTSVQDIFDFLMFYFANDPRADVNNSGSITVQDIFDFLSAYFSGC